MTNTDDNNIDLKAILVGESGVGKTNLINTSLGKEFDPNNNTTVAKSYSRKEFQINDKKYDIDLWDTAGQESYRGITTMFINNSQIVIFVYDITNKKSFDELKKYWLNIIKEKLGNNFIGGVVGNKTDLNDNQKVENEEGQKFAESNGFKFALVSAKSTPILFTDFLEDLIKQYAENEKNVGNKKRAKSFKINTQSSIKKKKFCC